MVPPGNRLFSCGLFAVHPSRAGTEFHFEGETDHSGVSGRGDSYALDLPIFATVKEAVAATGANASVVYVPPPFAADAVMEAAAADLDSPSPRQKTAKTWLLYFTTCQKRTVPCYEKS